MKNRTSNLKNMLWAVGILLCLLAMLVGLIFAMSQKNTEKRMDGTLTLGQIERREKPTDVDLAGLELKLDLIQRLDAGEYLGDPPQLQNVL